MMHFMKYIVMTVMVMALSIGCDEEGSDADAADAGPADAGPADAGPADAGSVSDAQLSDADSRDGDLPDADLPDSGLPEPCEADPIDAPRVVLLGHPFSPNPEIPGTDIRSLTLSAHGALFDDGMRLDMGAQVARLAFVPSGRFALVLGEDGSLHSVSVGRADELEIVDAIAIPRGGMSDLVVSPDGERVHIMNQNNAPDAGIYTVWIDCDGHLRYEDHFFPLRLAAALALDPTDADRALLLGGQATFEPTDDDDLRLLEWTEDGWAQVGAFDIFHDHIDNDGITISPDGRTGVVPNGSPFSDEGSQVLFLDLSDGGLRETSRLYDLPDARQARFSPDGQTLLLSRAEPNRVSVLTEGPDGWDIVDEVRAGLAAELAMVRRGPLAGLTLVPAIDPSAGSQLIMLDIYGVGEVSEAARLSLGAGVVQIPGPVAVRP